ncbi:MAG: hypothetical protein ACD_64C00134G0003 [uncultured bacterium]|nr:MAG: hypothetical protein ACD_64C00134G0003 [uncultured bacterium]HLE76179.1 hypothetical protein [Candidatus Babeliales bacterium]
MDNCTYDKIRVLHDVSRLLWFIKQHAEKEIPANDPCHEIIHNLKKDLDAYQTALKIATCK